jgi:hypothetical protein
LFRSCGIVLWTDYLQPMDETREGVDWETAFGQTEKAITVQSRFELPFVRMRFESIQPPKPSKLTA